MIYRKDYRARIPMARWKKLSLVAAAVLAIGVGCFLWIPRTTRYRVNQFENFQEGVVARHAAWQAFRTAGVAAPFPTPIGLLERSITPHQARQMMHPKSLAFEALTPEQRRLFLQVSAPATKWAKSVKPLKLSVYESGVIPYWLVDGKEVSRCVGDQPPGGG